MEGTGQMEQHAAHPQSNVLGGGFAAIRQRVRSAVSAAIRAVRDPERWALLSCCDWYPDSSSFPSNHAALLRADASERRGQ
jgi:hypothetical protein